VGERVSLPLEGGLRDWGEEGGSPLQAVESAEKEKHEFLPCERKKNRKKKYSRGNRIWKITILIIPHLKKARSYLY